jgi:hypothetical protein
MGIKRKIGLTTDTAGDLKGAVYGISAVIITMEPGWDRTFLISLFLIVMAIISWLTVGNIPPEAAEELMVEKDLRDVLREGRDDD